VIARDLPLEARGPYLSAALLDLLDATEDVVQDTPPSRLRPGGAPPTPAGRSRFILVTKPDVVGELSSNGAVARRDGETVLEGIGLKHESAIVIHKG
jgi:hypothetical protein